MRKKAHKLFWIWDYDKEEKWLNEMAAKGYALVSVGLLTYIFEETNENKYIVRLELLEKPYTSLESDKYIRFVEQTGAEYIGNVKRNWVYFRKEKAKGTFELNNSNANVIKQLNRMLIVLLICMFFTVATGGMNVLLFFISGGTPSNLIIGVFNCLFTALLLYGLLKLIKQRKNILKEQSIFE